MINNMDVVEHIEKCQYPKCETNALGTYCHIPLCQKHLEFAEFARWLQFAIEEQMARFLSE